MHADDRFKADNQDNLNLTTSWDGGVVPGGGDVAVWDNRVTAPNTTLLGADASWAGIRILDPGGAVTINAGNTLTLGAAGMDTSLASQSLTLNNALTIGAPQTWNTVSAVTVSSAIAANAGNGVTKSGTGTLTLSGGITGFGDWMTIEDGIVNVNNGASTIPIRLNGGRFLVGAALSTPVDVAANGGTIQITANRTLSGAITGTGTATAIIGNASTTLSFAGANIMGNFAGTIALGTSPGGLRPNAASFAGSANMTVDLGSNNGYWTRNNSAAQVNIGALTGAAGTQLRGGGVTYLIGGKNVDCTFSGEIQNCSVVKVGTATLTLDGVNTVNTYAGSTTISNGVLQIGGGGSGHLGTGPVTNYAGVVFNLGVAQTFANVIAGTGSVTNAGSGKVSLTGASTYSGPTFISAGTLAIGTASAITGDFTVANGATLSALVSSGGATLTLGNVTFGSGSSYEFSLGTFGNPAGTVATNTGTVTLNGNVTVNLLGTNFSNGTITLLRYANRAGGGSFVLGSLPPNVNLVSFNDDTVNKRVTLTITVGAVVDQTLRWVSNANGDWDINNLGNQIWRVIGTGQLTNYYDGAGVLFDDTATGTTAINVTTTVQPSGVTVNNTNKTYTLGGSGNVSGATGLTKRGPGTLLITNANDYSGVTTIEAGNVRIAQDTGAIGGGGVTNNAALIIDKSGVSALPNTYQFFGEIAGTGSVTFLGVSTNDSTFQVMVGVIEGNPYSGGTVISNGLVRMDPTDAGNPALRAAAKSVGMGTGTINFLGNSLLRLDQAGPGDNGSATAANFAVPLHVPAGQIGGLLAPGRYTLSSTLTGAGTFGLTVGNVRGNVSGNWSAFTGQINISAYDISDDFRVFNAAGWPLAKLRLMTGVNMYSRAAANSVIPIGELSGDVGTQLDAGLSGGSESGNSVTWLIGGLNTDSTFAGNIVNGANTLSLIKQGTGRLTLSGVTTEYTGATTISNGVLALVGDTVIPNTVTITLAAPGVLDVSDRSDGTLHLGAGTNIQTLAGNGTIRGSLDVGALGVVSPGFSTGTLTITNAAILGGTTYLELNRSAGPITNDMIVAQSFSATGVLTVTNAGPGLENGDNFKLFSQAVSGFSAINLPPTNPEGNSVYTWTNRIAIDGTIRLLSGGGSSVNTNPTNITFSVSGGNLDLQWPLDRTGWTLQSNSVGVAASSSWFEYPPGTGSRNTNRVIVPIDKSKTNVLYRLVYP